MADVLPPPEYILEEFLVVHQLADPAYRSYLAGLEQKHEALHRDFEDRHKFWAENLPGATPADKEIRQAMLVDAYAPAQRFFQLCQDQFLPMVSRSDYAAAAQLLHGPLQENYEAHRVAIDQVVTLTNTRNQVIEAEVDKVVAARLAILGAFGVAIVVGLTLGLIRFVRGVIAAVHRDATEKTASVAPSSASATPATPTGSSSDRQLEALADVVNNLANQVHILTFNAATEAARTSEQARDSSAVAAEIRQSSAEAESWRRASRHSSAAWRRVRHHPWRGNPGRRPRLPMFPPTGQTTFRGLRLIKSPVKATSSWTVNPWFAWLPGLLATAALGGLFLLTVPAAWGQDPNALPTPSPPAEECRVGAYVVNLNELDLVKKSFQIELWLWAVTPNQPEPLKTLEILDAHDVKFQSVRSEKTSDPYQNFGADRQVFYSSRKVTATVRHSWDVVNYPFDRHVLTVEMEDAVNPDEKIVFVPDTEHTRLRKDLQVEGWKVTDVSFTVRRKVYDTTFGDPKQTDSGGSGFSRLVLAISIEREVRTSFWKLTAGVYAAFVLALLGFYYDTEQASLMSPRTSIVVGSLFAALVNMRGVESVLGRTETLTLVDKIHILTILYIFVAAAACIGSRLLCEYNRRPLALFLDRRVLFPVFLVTYIILNSALIWQATYVG